MAGYSKNPLFKKLGIKSGMDCCVINKPSQYERLIKEVLKDVKIHEELESQEEFIHAFFKDKKELESKFKSLKNALKKDGVLWISWPKKTSSIKTDLDGNIVREVGLENGLVDIKVCAVDNDWSGLKFMYRVKDR
jgi:hypothetical protein